MGLFGLLLGGGHGPAPLRPPPGAAGATAEAVGDRAAADRPAAGASVDASPVRGDVAPAAAAPATGGASGRPAAGTSVDASPVRAEFAPAAAAPDEDVARAFAVAAQAVERARSLADGLAAGPKASPGSEPAPDGKAGTSRAEAAINATLWTLRGEKAAGAVLDKVA